MERVGDFVIRDFLKAKRRQMTADFRGPLVGGKAVVVMEDNAFFGVLTLGDLAMHPFSTVIDALSPKPVVDHSENVLPVLMSMCKNNLEFLPVNKKGVFEGVISKNCLILDLTGKVNSCDPGDERFSKLNNELAFKNQFLSILSHDLKNMFNQVLGSMELLERKLLQLRDDKVKAIFRLTRQSAEQVNLAFEDMLLWARLGSGQLPFNPEVVHLTDQFEKTVNQFQLAGDVKGITIRNMLKEEVLVYADHNMLNCILLNLVNNAIKFTPPKGEIRLNGRMLGDKTEIVVEDSGQGMSLRQKDQLFKEMFSTSGTQNEMGAGIGLVICKDFVEKHQGKMEVESDQGKGTRVVIGFPKLPERTESIPA